MGLRWWDGAIEWCTRVEWIQAPHQKLSHQGSVMANKIRGVSRMHQGGCHEVAEHGVEVVGGRD
jgi:hypothetical protein